ncbi:glycoside hydrolase family 5 protein [Pseudorhizobium pelagicum]|mgnify:FL=1|uniref:Glycoside hydrolase family 5 n=1 Tax=Pseudorhizobium pelagicum TaxID=1509405 RepID=A0A922NXY8_9HYPH|nr:cellulase family glycosylhydrolase [Pseudorhizobium pelagicum]KEQ02855.1 glycoside hydrolase family 5 [Pseudorhizobium pelagicum]KEQ02862.1 glycoside hydrolase family 5 [Pseudorhizobium pelagicum]
MKARVTILLVLLAGTLPETAASFEMRRGVGVHEWLNWSPIVDANNYAWPPYRSINQWRSSARPLSDWPEGDALAAIREIGFDFVRLSVDPGPLLTSEGAKRQQALDIIVEAVSALQAAGLNVVVNLHSVSQIPAYGMEVIEGGADSDGILAYREMVKAVARAIVKTKVDQVALEPYNEPGYYPCDESGTEDWQRIIATTVADIRSVDPNLPIIATGACGGSITGLTDLQPSFDDRNIYYSFHMYEPHEFTHQGALDPEDFLAGLPWPSTSGSARSTIEGLRAHMQAAGLDEGQQQENLDRVSGTIGAYFRDGWTIGKMRARLDEAAQWAKRYGIPSNRLFMGEFGARRITHDGRSGAYDADRLTYLNEIRSAAEAHDIPWSVWEYSNPHGMTVIETSGPAVPDMGVVEALGLPMGGN